MPLNTKNILECYSCGLFTKKDKAFKYKLKCPRCTSTLFYEKKHSFDSLYYAISALLMFLILSTYPLVTSSLVGGELNATLFGSILMLLEQNFFLVALLVFFTIILAPVLNSLIIIFSFLQKYTKFRLFTDTFLHDSFYFFKQWAFVDVFVISIIVTYIKLIAMFSSTYFDIGFYMMLVYIFCFFMANNKFEGKDIFGE